MTANTDRLNIIAHTSRILHDIVEGHPVSTADLHKAAAVSGWIAETPQADQNIVAELYTDSTPERLADLGRAFLALALNRMEEQETE
ncbi:hypothetical protein [Ligilactobacillus salivarius]|uniref:hypothetical protein n=1 Tax=Ligilactobacillus salivarius TaxID=1624 RepID=UPI003F8C0F56